MKDHKLKSIISVIFIFSHFALVISAFCSWKWVKGFTFDEALDSMLILGPMLTGYSMVMMRSVFYPPAHPSQKERTLAYVILSIGLFSLLVGFLAFSMKFKSDGDITFDSYKKLLAGIDTLFALYLTQVMGSLFEGDAPAAPIPPPGAGAGGGQL